MPALVHFPRAADAVLPLFGALLLTCTAAQTATELPPRKPGLWEMKMSSLEGKMPPQTVQHCIDARTDAAMREMGQGTGREKCTRHDMRQEKTGHYVIDAVCPMGQTVATSHTEISGDFASSYRMDVHTRYNPPLRGRSDGRAVIEAKWVGPCKPDQKPGDMMMPGGVKMNMMEQGPPGAAPPRK